jgi:hypothetical protein
MGDAGSMDDENGNCRRCGHPFDPHQITVDTSDYAKGGTMTCPVEGCDCFHTVSIVLNDE